MEQTASSWTLQGSAHKTQLNSTGESVDSAADSYPSRETTPTSIVEHGSERHDSVSTEQSRDIESPAQSSHQSHSAHTSPSTTPIKQETSEEYQPTETDQQQHHPHPGRGIHQGSFASHLPEPSLLPSSEDVEVFFNHLEGQPIPFHQYYHHSGTVAPQNTINQAYHQATMSIAHSSAVVTTSMTQPTYETSASYMHSATSPVYVPTTRAPVLTMPGGHQYIQGASPGPHLQSNPHTAALAGAAVWSPQSDSGYAASGGHQRYSAYPPNSPPISSAGMVGRTHSGLGGYPAYVNPAEMGWSQYAADVGRTGTLGRRTPPGKFY